MERKKSRLSSSNGRRLYGPIRSAASYLFALLAFSVVMTAQKEVLTNEVVVNMTKAHLSEKVIVEMIQDNPGKYVVTASALIALKQQGVSDGAISAMRARMASKSDAPPSAPKGAPPPVPQQSSRRRPAK